VPHPFILPHIQRKRTTKKGRILGKKKNRATHLLLSFSDGGTETRGREGGDAFPFLGPEVSGKEVTRGKKEE